MSLKWYDYLIGLSGLAPGYFTYRMADDALSSNSDRRPGAGPGGGTNAGGGTFGNTDAFNPSLESGSVPGSSSAGSLPDNEVSDTGIGDDADLSTPYNFYEYLNGLLSSVGAENEANRTYNATQAAINRNWQERMSSTSYQRAVKDLKAAGLNPVLAYTNLNSAAQPYSSQASYNVGGGDTLSDLLDVFVKMGQVVADIIPF